MAVAEQELISVVSSPTLSTAPETADTQDLGTIQSKSASPSAKHAHPGDPRRSLSAKPKIKPSIKANTVSFKETPDDGFVAHMKAYWSNQASQPSAREMSPDFP